MLTDSPGIQSLPTSGQQSFMCLTRVPARLCQNPRLFERLTTIRRGRCAWQVPYRSSPGALGRQGPCCWMPLGQCNFSPSLGYKHINLPIKKNPNGNFFKTKVSLFYLVNQQNQPPKCIDSTAPPCCHPCY